MMTDPLTGETRPVQPGPARSLGIILDTSLRMAWARGRWQAIRRLAHMRPWLRCVAIPDARTRPGHAGWHGTVPRRDHPAWKTHYPPCGRNCRCTVRQLSDRDPERLGLKPPQAPPEDRSKTRPWHNARTGRIEEVLQGRHFRSGEEPEATLHRHVWLCNRQFPQSALPGRTPLQAMRDRHRPKPQMFKTAILAHGR